MNVRYEQWIGLALWAVMSATVAVRAQESAAQDERESQVALRLGLEKWLEQRRLISEAKQSWRLGREMLGDRIALLQGEIDDLAKKRQQTEAEMTATDARLGPQVTRRDELKQAGEEMRRTVRRFEERVKELLARSPVPIVEKVKPLSQRIPYNPNDTDMSAPERFQNVIGIINEINKFCREVTIASEVRELPDGSSAEVSVMYLGLGQAYYCNAGRGIAGVGRLGSDGWEWAARNELAPLIEQAIAVHRNEVPAAYVVLPVEIR